MWSELSNWIKLSIVSPKEEHPHNYNAIVTIILSKWHVYKCWIYLEYRHSYVISIQQRCVEPFDIFNLNQCFSYNIELFATCESLSRRPGQQLLQLRALHSSLVRMTSYKLTNSIKKKRKIISNSIRTFWFLLPMSYVWFRSWLSNLFFLLLHTFNFGLNWSTRIKKHK